MIAIVRYAINVTKQDFSVICGLRTMDEQRALVAKGASQTMKSKHIGVSFNNFFDSNGHYLLSEDVELAYEKLPKDRDQYDKDLIKVDERVNICFAIYSGGIFRFFPLPNDSNNTWLTDKQATEFSSNDSLFVSNIMPMYFKGLKEAFYDNSHLRQGLNIHAGKLTSLAVAKAQNKQFIPVLEAI